MTPALACLPLLLLAAPAEPLKLPVTRDTWFSGVGAEAAGNNGGSPRLKVKSYQEFSVLDVDPTPLRGRVVLSATLHLHLDGPEPLRRVTVGTFAAPWFEGKSASYQPEPGASSYLSQRHPDTPWTPDGGDVTRVILAQGGTLWKMADATPPDALGWQSIPVDPAVVAARVAGVSEGFLVFDDTGSEWTRNGESFEARHMPNRLFSSRDSNRASAPYMTIALGPEDHAPPLAPTGLRSTAENLPAGEATVTWTTPADVGPAGVSGFLVDLDGQPAPRPSIPRPGRPGDPARMALRLPPSPARTHVKLSVRAVDGVGNPGPAATIDVPLSTRTPAPLPVSKPAVPRNDAPGPKLGASRVAILDELDKIQPATGKAIPPLPPGDAPSNHLWDSTSQQIHLTSARNEFVAFQVLIHGRNPNLRASLSFDHPTNIQPTFGRYALVSTKLGPLPDPIVPLGGPDDRGPAADATSQSLHVELYIPHDTPPGDHPATLTLTSGPDALKLKLRLKVWDFTLPDHLSFLPEMNCYGLPADERAYYRLAHAHRTVLNRVPYSQRGEVADGCAPTWNVKSRSFDWSAYDARFGPLLDGTAFADLPRKNVPVDVFYLPLNENWPTPIDPNYNGSYWADEAFTPAYRAAFVDASRQFARHLDDKGWSQTLFEGFLNDKVDFKRQGWSRGSSPWLLDEPANFQDFWALRYFAAAFHEGVKQASPRKAKLAFRADISRPEWQRDSLDGLLDVNVVGGAFRQHRPLVLDRKAAEGQVVFEYGGANPIEESNIQPLAWSLDAWSLGLDGVIPWQTIGNAESWKTADPLSLFYPTPKGPIPSVRLKAFRRGQQDIEYLTLWALASHEPRWAVGARVRESLGLAGTRGASGLPAVEDAGVIRYGKLRPEDAWALRQRIGQALSDRHPAPKSRLIDLRTPPRDPSHLAPALVATPARP